MCVYVCDTYGMVCACVYWYKDKMMLVCYWYHTYHVEGSYTNGIYVESERERSDLERWNR